VEDLREEAIGVTPERVGLSATAAEVTLDLRLPGGTVVPSAIRARAEAAGGRVEALRVPGGATRVRVALPQPS
jgi:signal transduction histidine kinase